MSEALRRSTLQPTADLYNNARSGIPMPSTAKKAGPSAMRMSLAGAASRTPYLPSSGVGPSSNPAFRSHNANPLLQSTSKPNYGRTPLTKYAYSPILPTVLSDCIIFSAPLGEVLYGVEVQLLLHLLAVKRLRTLGRFASAHIKRE